MTSAFAPNRSRGAEVAVRGDDVAIHGADVAIHAIDTVRGVDATLGHRVDAAAESKPKPKAALTKVGGRVTYVRYNNADQGGWSALAVSRGHSFTRFSSIRMHLAYRRSLSLQAEAVADQEGVVGSKALSGHAD